MSGCRHLALAAEGRDFVRSCIERSQAEISWRLLCQQRSDQQRIAGMWSPQQDDFTWLETAFCEEFLRDLTWFDSMDHEWRTGPHPGQGGFWVLLWSKDPQRLWWELKDAIEAKTTVIPPVVERPPWLIWLTPK